MKTLYSRLACLFLGSMLVTPLIAEDIEIYVGSEAYRQGSNAKVMIIFDNSGSMRTLEEVKVAYNPGTTYETKGYEEFSDAAIYFSRGDNVDSGAGLVPTSHSDSRRFNKDILGCETAWEKLRTVGYYTGYLREYQIKGSSGSWEPLPAEMGLNTNNPVDCYDDIVNKNPKNGTYSSKYVQIPNDRYPINGTGNAKTSLETTAYTTDWELANSQSSALQGGVPITLYTANYINYYHATTADVGTETKTRLEIAKETIDELLTATPGVDFGMLLFNLNAFKEGDRDGGRIVSGIKTMTDANRQELLNTLQEIDAETNTPLCESLMEAKRYYAGDAVVYGIKDTDYKSNSFEYIANTPPRDKSIESNSKYITPYDECSDIVYTILITDGVPTLDNFADDEIKALESTVQPYTFASGTKNYLPVLSSWMFNHDINPNLDGKQTSRLFTIGFGDSAVDEAGGLLQAAADNGGGNYYAARDSAALAAALQGTLLEILRVNTTFTSPSVASNNFDRTRSLDAVYYAMFLPDSGTRWTGNLKKLKLSGNQLLDKNGNNAIDAKTGAITDSAFTYWNDSGVADGNQVAEGGVAAQLQVQQQRNFYTNANGALTELKATLADYLVDALASGLDVETVKSNINWARGIDVDDDDNDGDKTDLRRNLMGDPLHSKPLVLSYDNGDSRILVGTNMGFMHMFKDSGDTVEESWAFMPRELMNNIPELRVNQNGNPKIYGVDGSPTAYFRDLDGDGKIGSEDKVWLFFGLRRGGSSYYAMDITNPDQPKLMWHIDKNSSGFEEMGQSWSKPVVTFIKSNGAKPVLLIGGGYSTNKDPLGLGTPDSEGRAVFIVDAQSGSLIKAFNGPSYGGEHSVPGSVSFLDSDYDAYADRLYFADTGGAIWRADLAGDEPSNWGVVKFAQLNGGTLSEDRRFFYEPVVARALMEQVTEVDTEINGVSTKVITTAEVPYDAVVVGSGSRPHPLSSTTQDMLFVLRDMNTITQQFTVDNTPDVITISDLYKVTDVEPRTAEQFEQLQKDMTATKGWYYELATSEKSLSAASVLGGVAYFTSYIPAAEVTEESCSLAGGDGGLYAFNLNYGTRVYSQLRIKTTQSIPEVPDPVVPPCEGEDCSPKLVLIAPTPTELELAKDPIKCEGEECDEQPDDSNSCNSIGGNLKLATCRLYIVIDENM